jgi:hypothetical protein
MRSGRGDPALYEEGKEKHFDVKQALTFIKSQASLPQSEGLYTEESVDEALKALVDAGELELKQNVEAKMYYFGAETIPAERELPDWVDSKDKHDTDSYRNKLYVNGSGLTDDKRDEVRERGLRQIKRVVDAYEANANDPTLPDLWAVMRTPQVRLVLAEDDVTVLASKDKRDYYRKLENVQADHEPALAQHWTSGGGFDAKYSVRQGHAKAGIRPMNIEENKKRGSDGAKFKDKMAGRNFSSKGTETYGKWWCTEDTPFKGSPQWPNPPKNK